MPGLLIKKFYTAVKLNNSLPENYSESDSLLFAKDRQVALPESALFCLSSVYVTHNGIIYKNFKAIKENITCYELDFKKYKHRYLLRAFLKLQKKKYAGNQCLIIFDNYSGPKGFAHWLCDGLTRLAEMNGLLHEYTLIAPDYFKNEKIYAETLSYFNVSKIHYLEKNSITHFKELHLVTQIAETGNFRPENIDKLRNIILPKVKSKKVTSPNIYISRAKASRRFVLNEGEVINALKKFDFEIVYLEDHSFDDQLAIINRASQIVSIHGAALSMLMFASKNCRVLELRDKNENINNMYYQLCCCCNLNYYYLGCESFKNSETANNFDIKVNIQYLEKWLTKMAC